jgi:predicted RNA-binding protein with PUA-like domain
MHYWLVKSEPGKYSWDQFCKDGSTYWDEVRNYQARNNLQAMKTGDKVLYYHSNDGLAVIGVARVITEAYQDPSTDDERWVVVDLEPIEALPNPVTLSEIKQDKRLQDIPLIKQSRLSVMPLAKKEYDLIVKKGKGQAAGAKKT